MPYYQFLKNDEIFEFFFPINEAPPIGSIIKIKNKKYQRIPSNIQAAVDTKLNPFSKEDFIRKTNKPGKYGDLVDLSREMHERRKDKIGGSDEIREKFAEKSKNKRNGKFIDDLGN